MSNPQDDQSGGGANFSTSQIMAIMASLAASTPPKIPTAPAQPRQQQPAGALPGGAPQGQPAQQQPVQQQPMQQQPVQQQPTQQQAPQQPVQQQAGGAPSGAVGPNAGGGQWYQWAVDLQRSNPTMSPKELWDTVLSARNATEGGAMAESPAQKQKYALELEDARSKASMDRTTAEIQGRADLMGGTRADLQKEKENTSTSAATTKATSAEKIAQMKLSTAEKIAFAKMQSYQDIVDSKESTAEDIAAAKNEMEITKTDMQQKGQTYRTEQQGRNQLSVAGLKADEATDLQKMRAQLLTDLANGKNLTAEDIQLMKDSSAERQTNARQEGATQRTGMQQAGDNRRQEEKGIQAMDLQALKGKQGEYARKAAMAHLDPEVKARVQEAQDEFKAAQAEVDSMKNDASNVNMPKSSGKLIAATRKYEAIIDSLATKGGGPQVGDIEDGHKFKGGDPSDKANWEPVN